MEIPDFDPKVHLHALKTGLRPGKFRETIAITKPKSLEKFRERAASQMEIEKLREAQKPDKQLTRREEERTFKPPNKKEQKKPFKLTPKFNIYTRFNTKKKNIIKEILNAKIVKPPARAGNYQDQRFMDRSKHYAFHQKYGHTTDECVIGKDLLERPPRGIINCTSGGYAGGGETSSARKRSYRGMLAIEGTIPTTKHNTTEPEITFNQDDLASTGPNLDDPVVISIQTGELLVRKVLLDPSSSADVLFYSTFIKMQLFEKAMQPSSGELVGFFEERVPIKGHVWLKTTMGDHPLAKTIDVQYLIVDYPSPYNIILERPALNKFRAVVSTLHLCVKFQVQNNKIATVHSDQQQARQCYNASLKKTSIQPRANQGTKTIHTTSEVLTLAELDPREDFQERPQPIDELQKIPLTTKAEQFTYIGRALEGDERADLIRVL
ncbi:uncharacterized protein [Arachis hypogaea]|uniref:uncharacterized protein n=1 Tax=Arachis hypogaea TaxID=3818 RepID=UPI000DECA6D7|nr:uncharacterized protein LOC112717917 [Arachis hypogaea]